MTVKEVRQLLNRMAEIDSYVDDYTFGIATNEISIGAQIHVLIQSIVKGFDWDHGIVLAFTDTPIIRK